MSNGHVVTSALWRANRLVDAMAKRAAKQHTVGSSVLKAFKLAEATALHGAAVLGMVTKAANSHRVEVVDESGDTKVQVCRDVTPHTPASRPPTTEGARHEGSTCKRLVGDSATAASTPQTLARAHAGRLRTLAAATDLRAEARFWANWQGPTLTANSDRPSAADRLDALRARVRCRFSLR